NPRGAPVSRRSGGLGRAREVMGDQLGCALGRRREALRHDAGHPAVERLPTPSEQPGVRRLLQQGVGELIARAGARHRPDDALRGQERESRLQVRSAERLELLEQLLIEFTSEYRGNVNYVTEIREAIKTLGQQALQGRRDTWRGDAR